MRNLVWLRNRLCHWLCFGGLCFGVVVVGCNESPKDVPVEGEKTQAVAPKATPPPAPPPPPSRAILAASLNASVADKSQFEDAPLYEIDVDIDFELLTYRGHQKLTVVNAEKDALQELHFLVYPNTKELTEQGTRNLTVRDVTVDGKPVPVTLQGAGLRIPLAKPLAPKSTIVVEFDFQGVIHRLPPDSSDMEKMAVEQILSMVTGGSDSKGGYGVFSHGDGIVSLALWHPILVAYDQRGWDLDPGSGMGDRSYFDVANYAVRVNAPKGVVVATTGVAAQTEEKGDRVVRRFVAGAVREFTIQAANDYASVEKVVDGTTVRSYFLTRHRAVGTQVLDQAAEALRIFNRDYGPYPYTELEIAEAPLIGGAGGVEFPGLVTVAKMFYGDGPAGGLMGQGVPVHAQRYLAETREFVVAHEVAHQWWNAVVGSDSKRHPFVDEALANHSAIHYFERAHGPEAAERQRELQMRLNYQVARMAGASDRPVDLPAQDYDGMLEYAAMVYAKGGLFFSALRDQMGGPEFDAALRAYYSEYSFKIATPEGLIEAFAKSARDPKPVRDLARRWLKERHGDADIGRIKVASLLKHLGGKEVLDQIDPRLLTVLEHRGVDELGKIVKQLIDPQGAPREDIDYSALIGLVTELSLDNEKMGRWIGLAARVLSDDKISPAEIFRTVGKEIADGDKKTEMLLEGLGIMLEAIEQDL